MGATNKDFDTIICSAHENAFDVLCETHGMWASVRINQYYLIKPLKLKYCALYRTQDRAVTHYAEIVDIIQIPDTAQNEWKSIIFFKKKSLRKLKKRVGFWATNWIQKHQYTTLERLQKIETLDDLKK